MPPDAPLVPDVGVVALVYHHWGSHWMTPHHVLTRLGRYFHVVWVNPAPGWREVVRARVARPVPVVDGVEGTGFRVYVPGFWLPTFFRPAWLARLTFVQRLRRARRLLVHRGCRKVVLHLWHPQFAPALCSMPFDLSCYHIDDEYRFYDVKASLDEAEVTLIRAVDQVFAISPGLMERKGHINPHTTFSPEGVDYAAYATPVAEPADLASIRHPRVGYTGTLKRQLDWDLLDHLVQRHPQWSFVFVGPIAPHPEIAGIIQELGRRPNVHFLGPKSVRDLTAYPQHFDVCLMPYRIDDYTRYIYPLKLHEYLASGQPTVGARIRSLEEFAEVVALPRTPAEWSAAISQALSPGANTPEHRASRQAVARNHDWSRLVEEIADTMVRRLDPNGTGRSLQSLRNQ